MSERILFGADTEKTMIGSFLQDSTCCKALLELSVDDFYFPQNREIFDAMRSLHLADTPVDVMTVSDELSRRGTLDGVGGASYMLQAFRFVPTTANFGTYKDMLLTYSKRRKIVAAAKEMEQAVVALDDVDTVIENSLDKLRAIGKSSNGWISLGSIAAKAYEDIERLASGEVTHLKSGLPDLDRRIGGFYDGELTILAARPAVGKSALGATIGYNLALKGKRVGVCSLEMSPTQYIKRLLSSHAMVSGRKLRIGKGITPEEWVKLSDACGEMQKVRMPFTFSVSTIEELRAHAQHMKDTDGLDMLIVDYMQLLQTKKPCESDYVRISTVSHALKRLALDLQIPILALAQVSRPQVKGAQKMPTLDCMRGSGDIEQDADCVIFLHPTESADDKDVDPMDRERVRDVLKRGAQYIILNVAKNRNGECGMFGMTFEPEYMLYACLDREH